MPLIKDKALIPGDALLRRVMGKGDLFKFLNFYGFADTVFGFDDFLGDTINLDLYAVANSAGTGAADFAIVADVNGAIQGDTGTTDNGSVSLIGPLIYKGDDNCGMAVRFKIDDVSEAHFEVGFIDGVPASNTGGVNDIDTPTFYAGDSALLAYDTDQTATGLHFATNGSTTGQPDQATALVGTTALTDATWEMAVVQLSGNNAYLTLGNAKETVNHNTDADGHVEGGTALAPWVYCQTRNTTAKFPEVDFIATWHDRSAN